MGHEFSRIVSVSECEAPEKDDCEFRLGPSPNSLDPSDAETATPRSEPSSLGADTPSVSSPVGSATQFPVLVFDWDDTLLCSTALNQNRWSWQQLRDLEAAIESMLHCATLLGETMIITNGNATWVQDSVRRYLPALVPIISRIKVVSARALCEDRYPGDPYMWKRVAFQEILVDGRPLSTASGLNLIACGDQKPEIDAAEYVIQFFERSRSFVKTVKFKEAPSLQEVIGQLGKLEADLPAIVAAQESLSCTLSRASAGFGAHRNRPDEADGWKLAASGKADSPWNLVRSLSMKDLWPLFS